MVRKGILILVSMLLTLSMLNLGGVAETLQFVPSNYYIVPLGEIDTDIQTLTQTALDRGLSVVVYNGNSAAVYEDGVSSDRTPEAAYETLELLVVDAGRFYLRLATQSASYAVRPAEDGYEIVLSPSEELGVGTALASILIDLQDLGALGINVSLDLSQIVSFARSDLKGPPPPAGVGIESTLYSLVIAEDWFAHAATHGLALTGLRVAVVAERLPGAALAESFQAFIDNETEQLSSLSLPIDLLLPLAQSLGVGYVRPPYRPAIP